MTKSTTVKQIRDHLQSLLAPYLGDYRRPDGSTVPAVWVWDRAFPSDYKMIVSAPNEPMVNALELSISKNHVPDMTRGGFSHFIDWRVFDVRLVQHDRRQPIADPMYAILTNYTKTKTPVYLEGTDFAHSQLVFELVAPIQVSPV